MSTRELLLDWGKWHNRLPSPLPKYRGTLAGLLPDRSKRPRPEMTDALGEYLLVWVIPYISEQAHLSEPFLYFYLINGGNNTATASALGISRQALYMALAMIEATADTAIIASKIIDNDATVRAGLKELSRIRSRADKDL